MLMKSYFCLLMLAGSLLGASAQEIPGVQKEGKDDVHFTMTPPKGWYCINDKKELPGKVQAVYIGNGNGTFTPSLNLATEKTDMQITEYVALAKKYHMSQGETKCQDLGTLKTKSGEAYILQIDRKTQWGDVRFIQASLIKDGIAYVLTGTCLNKEFSTLCPQFFQSIQSFTLDSASTKKRPLSSINSLDYKKENQVRRKA